MELMLKAVSRDLKQMELMLKVSVELLAMLSDGIDVKGCK